VYKTTDSRKGICCPKAVTLKSENSSEKFSVIFLLWKQVMFINDIKKKVMSSLAKHVKFVETISVYQIASSLCKLMCSLSTNEASNF